MPRLSRWCIRASLLHLAAGVALGTLLLVHKGIPLHPGLWRLLPPHIEFLLLGWTLQLAIGVMFWSLPRFQRGPERGNEALAWWAFGLLNVGVVLVSLSSVLGGLRWLPVLGRLIEACGGHRLCCTRVATGEIVRQVEGGGVSHGASRYASSGPCHAA